MLVDLFMSPLDSGGSNPANFLNDWQYFNRNRRSEWTKLRIAWTVRPGTNTTNEVQFAASIVWLVASSDVSANVADANGLWLFTGNATTTNGYYRSYVR